MTEFACNYALIRFMPYREAGEFVNVGVVLACGATGTIDFLLERKRFKRVTGFFPELKNAVYRHGLNALNNEIERIALFSKRFAKESTKQRELWVQNTFAEIVRPRETLFHFSAPRTVLTDDPQQELRKLFALYVERQFPPNEHGREEKLRRDMKQCLAKLQLARFYNEEQIGTEEYHVRFPFVAKAPVTANLNQTIVKVIKPLDLARNETSEIYDHGDNWIKRLERLSKIGHLPPEILFAIKQGPPGNPQNKAATEIRRELEDLGAQTVDFDDVPKISRFARLD